VAKEGMSLKSQSYRREESESVKAYGALLQELLN
jgi:hypothetical protein